MLYPALSRSRWRRTLAADAAANLLRNLWAYMVIFRGHFPDGAEKFTAAVLEHETRGRVVLRQMLGAANFKAGPLLAFSSGNLCYHKAIARHTVGRLSNEWRARHPRVPIWAPRRGQTL